MKRRAKVERGREQGSEERRGLVLPVCVMAVPKRAVRDEWFAARGTEKSERWGARVHFSYALSRGAGHVGIYVCSTAKKGTDWCDCGKYR